MREQVRDDYVPKALADKPDLDSHEERLLVSYSELAAMVPEGFSGRGSVTLREIDLYLSYYPVDDVYYFVDLMRAIDRGIHSSSQG